jgi:NADH-quinone oxidoreductase subunit B
MPRDEWEGLAGLDHNFITAPIEGLVKWARARSVMPATFGLACCAIEMMGTGAAHYDLSRYGMEVFRASPRQADLMIVAGRVSQKMAPVLRQVYDQMMEPKWVISMGVCASSGGMFNNYAIVQGVDQIVPVDVYAPGCPPGPQTLMHAIFTLHEKILSGELTKRREQTGVGAGIVVDQHDGQIEDVPAPRLGPLPDRGERALAVPGGAPAAGTPAVRILAADPTEDEG